MKIIYKKLIYHLIALLIFVDGCQDKKDNGNENLNQMDNQEIQKKYDELSHYFGKLNLQIEVKQDIINDPNPDFLFVDDTSAKYIKVRITHLPTGKVALGESYDNQLMNSVEALTKLKKEIKKTNAQH